MRSSVEQYGFPPEKLLFAGIVNGKNIWVNHYEQTLQLLQRLEILIDPGPIVLSASCSLLYVPYSVRGESQLAEKYAAHFAFAEEKLAELAELAQLSDDPHYAQNGNYLENQAVIGQKNDSEFRYEDIRERVANLMEADFIRKPAFEERRKLQKRALKLPLLPTTTIGSFPQTADVKKLRSRYRNGEINASEYTGEINRKITEVIELQEEIGLDVLVHGEYERNDMVEYFGEKLAGFVFTKKAWVQSYGTRCVKPPVIFGDVKRFEPMTVDVIRYAQSLRKRIIKRN